MNPKPFSHRAGIPLFALFLALLAPWAMAASDLATPITTSLSVVTTPTTSVKGVVSWSGIPDITPLAADLKFLVTYPDGVQRKMAAQRLTLTTGKLSQAAFTFATPRAGVYTIYACMTIYTSTGRFARTDKLRFNVPRSGPARLEREPQMTANQVNAKISGRLHQKPAPRKATSLQALDTSGFTVSGRLLYTKVEYNIALTTITTHTAPLRFARLLVCNDLRTTPSLYGNPNAYLFEVLGETTTDANGDYSYYVSSNDNGILGGRNIFIEVMSDSAMCKVADPDDVIYQYDSPVTWDYQGGATLRVNDILSQTASGPWNILSAISDGYNLVKRCGKTPPKVTLRWAPGNPLGTYFSRQTGEITVRGESSDPDEFDDAVIDHEYGHFIAHTFSVDKSPGGMHYWDRPYERTLAWSEGWATFFTCAARNDKYYTDMYGGKTAMVINLELPTGDYPRGDDVEAAVAASLWDIYDSSSDYHDTLSDGMTHIWPIFNRYFNPTLSATLQDFYNGWGALSYPNRDKVRAILDQHGINYWGGGLMVDSLLANNAERVVASRTVTLDNLCSGDPAWFMVSENARFDGAIWQRYSAHPTYTVTSPGNGAKTLFFKVKNAAGRVSPVKIDFFSLNEQLPLTVADNAYIQTLVPTANSFDWYKFHISKAGWYSVYFTWSDSPLTGLWLFKASDVNMANPIQFPSTYDLSYIYQVAYLQPGDYFIVVLGERPVNDPGSIYRLGVSLSHMRF